MLRFALLACCATLLTSCGGSTDSPTPPPSGATTINPIVIVPTSLSIPQGSVNVFVAGTGRSGLTGGIDLTAEGAPTGMTISASAMQETLASSLRTFTVNVASTTTPGAYTLTVRARASGTPDVTTSYVVTVTPVVVNGGSYALSALPQVFSVAQGSTASTAVTLARTNFSGSVNLSVAGLPSGLTASFAPNNTTGATSTLTLSATSTVTAGLYILTIGGVAAGQPDRISQITVTVTAAAGFTLQALPATVSVAQNATATAAVNITRLGGFASAVSFGIGNVPTGVTATFSPGNTTGNSVNLTVSAGASAAAGNYTLLVTATAAGAATTLLNIPVAVTASTGGGSGNVIANFAQCPASNIPIWVAYQDGTGAWTRVTGTGNVYSFNLTSARGGIVWVTSASASQNLTTVAYYTRTEMTTAPLVYCGAPNTKSVSGIMAGISAGTRATVSLGNAATVVSGNLAFVLNTVADGVSDLVAYRQNTVTEFSDDRVLLRRDVTIGNGGALGSIDLNGSESVAAATATISVANSAGEQFSRGMSYLSGSTCQSAQLYTSSTFNTSTSFTLTGVPAAQQRATDYHRVSLTALGSTQNRTVIESFRALATRTIALPTALTGVTVTSLGGPYKRLQTAFTLPNDYQSAGIAYYDASGQHYVTIGASVDYFGSTSVVLGMPDLSAVSGWNSAWVPAASAAVSHTTYSNGSLNANAGGCVEGARVVGAQVNGTTN